MKYYALVTDKQYVIISKEEFKQMCANFGYKEEDNEKIWKKL